MKIKKFFKSLLIGSAIVALNVNKLTAGSITSKTITLEVSDGTGDVEIRAGIATGDFANSGAASGFIIGIDDDDSNKPKFFIGSEKQYLQFDGTNVSIGPETRILGANAYDNTSIFLHLLFGDVDSLSVNTTAGGSVTAGGNDIILTVNTGSDVAGATKKMSLPLLDYTWDKNRRWKSKVRIFSNDANFLAYWGMIDAASVSARMIAFKLVGTTLYGVVNNGSGETTVDLSTTVSGATKKYEIKRTASNNVGFYVDDVLKGSITTGIPSGSTNADCVAGFYCKETAGADMAQLTVSEAIFWQEE